MGPSRRKNVNATSSVSPPRHGYGIHADGLPTDHMRIRAGMASFLHIVRVVFTGEPSPAEVAVPFKSFAPSVLLMSVLLASRLPAPPLGDDNGSGTAPGPMAPFQVSVRVVQGSTTTNGSIRVTLGFDPAPIRNVLGNGHLELAAEYNEEREFFSSPIAVDPYTGTMLAFYVGQFGVSPVLMRFQQEQVTFWAKSLNGTKVCTGRTPHNAPLMAAQNASSYLFVSCADNLPFPRPTWPGGRTTSESPAGPATYVPGIFGD